MRLVCMADTHMFHADFTSVPDGDVLIHAGDMARMGSEEELREVARFLRAQPHRHKVVVAGNHDWLFQLEAARARELFSEFVYLEDTEATIDGVRFYGSPWTPVFYDWAFMKKRGAEIAEMWKNIPDGLDVLITHGPPHGILDDASKYRAGGGAAMPAGCADLRARVRLVKPRVHVFGHIHGQQGVVEEDGVRFVNCTTSECEQAPVVIDV